MKQLNGFLLSTSCLTAVTSFFSRRSRPNEVEEPGLSVTLCIEVSQVGLFHFCSHPSYFRPPGLKRMLTFSMSKVRLCWSVARCASLRLFKLVWTLHIRRIDDDQFSSPKASMLSCTLHWTHLMFTVDKMNNTHTRNTSTSAYL